METGHGKGPCDGVGGSIKKSAETWVKKENVIYGAKQFYDWAKGHEGAIKPLYVTEAQVSQAEQKIKNALYVKGISVAHSLRPHNGFVYMREVSCFQDCCRDRPTCPGWEKTSVPVVGEHNTTSSDARHTSFEGVQSTSVDIHQASTCDSTSTVCRNATDGDVESQDEVTTTSTNVDDTPSNDVNLASSDVSAPKYSVGDTVEAVYNRKSYVGEILEYSPEGDDYNIKFMKKVKGGKHVWPKRQDIVWVEAINVIRTVVIDNEGMISN